MRGIPLDTTVCYPQQVREEDFARADRIIALDETEHHPLLLHHLPEWVERVELWQVPDIPRAQVASALATMEAQVLQLIQVLTQPSS